MKRKGSRFERDLIEELWKNGFAAIRVAGSGVSHFPCPDIVAGDGKRFFAIEVKMRSSLPLYLTEEEIEKLRRFSEVFGAEEIIALKLPRKKWRFFKPEELGETSKGYRIDDDIYAKGKDIFDLKGLKQIKLE
ncbi:MAG: Holliday junction resolvase [Archaeoglobi archaeon]|jgi:Holliday junction resolvase|nr:Holliday junction resolvase Hjc [Archaeoglobi archaeon]NHW88304.1 Holliday junction resolvase [Archaeoglobales archaeon]TDA27254.1 MAG: Holliday junction resolvase [Archaeoglobi archaeon]TDA27709.1 MAG: Holliday junction resolvase [Archaeoglobi archaeon]TDA28341.1 MAG: Holliday junction resolvase [Archaeoglobi archaeon]